MFLDIESRRRVLEAANLPRMESVYAKNMKLRMAGSYTVAQLVSMLAQASEGITHTLSSAGAELSKPQIFQERNLPMSRMELRIAGL